MKIIPVDKVQILTKAVLIGVLITNLAFAQENKESENKVEYKNTGFLDFNVVDHLYVVAEYRINDFLPSENYGLGYGVEYKVQF